jgi:glycosyltransferase 2 family protein
MVKPSWKLWFLVAGLALFGWYLSRVDLQAVGQTLGRLGWLAPVTLLPYFCVYIVDCIGWRFCLPSTLQLSFVTLFGIRWCGEAVNNVLPSASVGGEAVKVYLLRQRGVPARTGTSSVVVGRSAQTAAQLLYIVVAALVFLQIATPQPGLRAGLLLILSGGAAVLAALFWIQSRGLFGSLARLACALHLTPSSLDRHRAKILEFDQAITGFYRTQKPRFFVSAGFYLGGWLLDTLEIYLVAWLLAMPISWPQALVVEAFTSIVKILGLWIPGTLGAQESGILLLGRLAGLPDTLSVAYALLRRAREIVFALVGWLMLYARHGSLRTIRAETAAVPAPRPGPAHRKVTLLTL